MATITIPKTNEIVKELTFYSEVKNDYTFQRERIKCFIEHPGNTLEIPRAYAEKKTNKNFSIDLPDNTRHIDVEFKGNLRKYQIETIDKTLDHFKTSTRGGIWSLSTGLGKTTCALYLLAKIKRRALIIVHKNVLLEQWKERIKQFLPNARVGIIQGQNLEIDGKDITLGMVQTLSIYDYSPGTFDSIGLVICDEVHMICCQTFSKVLFKVGGLYRLGLSATPIRKDGFEKIIYAHMGDIIVNISSTLMKPEIRFYIAPSNDVKINLNAMGKVNLSELITNISDVDSRNAFIIGLIVDVLQQNPRRKVLVFSDRVVQCERLDQIFKANSKSIKVDEEQPQNIVSDTFIGKKKKSQLDVALKANVIFATYSMCKEGFDCPELDTLVFASPKSDVVQAVGRILRQKNEYIPVVIDIVDKKGPLEAQYYTRRRYYQSKEYDIYVNNEYLNYQVKTQEDIPIVKKFAFR